MKDSDMIRIVTYIIAVFALASPVILVSCTSARYVVVSAPDRAPSDIPVPEILSDGYGQPAVSSLETWETDRVPVLSALFEDHVFGAYPEPARIYQADSRMIDASVLDGLGTLEERTITLEHPRASFQIKAAIALPHDADGPVPVFVIPNDCGNPFALKDQRLTAPEGPVMPYCSSDGFGGFIGRTIFGRYVLWPPMELLLEQGYGLVSYHEADVVADYAQFAQPILQALTPEGTPDQSRTGVVAAWGWTIDHVAQALESDPRINADQIAVMGHSRRGKAVLMAGVYGEAVDLIISHQSGTGGASLSRRDVGESIGEITDTYPHWFAPAFSEFAEREDELPMDQHQFIALVAPTPLLLGNARRDTWSDPVGAFMAARAAGAVWELYDHPGFEQNRLGRFDPSARLAFHIRFGTHGVTPEDWDAFLDFSNIQFGQQ